MDLDCTQEQALGLQAAWWDYTGDSMDVGGFNMLSVDTRVDMEVDGYAMAGGFLFLGILLGIIEIFSKAYISTQLSDAIVFAVLIIVLLIKPAGLLGKSVREKV